MSGSSGAGAVGKSGRRVVRFSTADYPPHERVEALHEIFGRNLQKVHVEPLDGGSGSFHTEVTLRPMPGLSLYTASRSAAIYRRSREFIEHDDLVLIAGFTSSYEVHHLGRTLNMRPGEAVILTGGEPASFGGPAQNSVDLLRVPVRLLSPFVAELEASYGRTIPADTPALQLLVGYIRMLDEIDAIATPEVERQVVTHIHDLMALAIGATRDADEIAKGRGVRAAWLAAIKDDIATSLDQPDLSAATIAARHRINPRSIQRLFESEGTTFTEYVMAQRLRRAHRLLKDPLRANQKVIAISLDVGFSNVSYFNRAFRRRYGITPSELRAAARSANQTTVKPAPTAEMNRPEGLLAALNPDARVGHINYRSNCRSSITQLSSKSESRRAEIGQAVALYFDTATRRSAR